MTDLALTERRGRRARTRRIVLLAVLLGVVGGVVGSFVGLRFAGIHTATASVLVAPLTGNPYSPTSTALVNLETEAQLVTSADVVSGVQQKLDGIDAAGLRSGLSVSVPSNTQTVTIAYSSRDGAQALQVAQAFADSYLAYRADRASSVVAGQTDQVEDQISILEKQQSKYGARLDKVDPDSGDAAVLRAQLESTTSQLDQLKTTLADLQATPLDPGTIITPASLPAPSPVPYWAIGALAGLLAGVVLGVLLGSLAFGRRLGIDIAPATAQSAGAPA